MMIHGRLLLTSSGMMLDEVRSLLQKALRRNERDLILQATKELLYHGKDQLPWKSLLTFLFEDHCLVDKNILKTFIFLINSEDKYKAVELLMQCPTSRIVACMPVIALRKEYEPTQWNTDIARDPSLENLVTLQGSRLHFGLVLLHLKKAWIAEDEVQLITYMKLASMVCDYDDPTVTKFGEIYLISKVKKTHFALVLLSMLHKNTQDSSLKEYIGYCYKLAATTQVPIRLVIFAPIAQLIFKNKISNCNFKLGNTEWDEVEKLSSMPEWATDKHTYRGKYGKASLPLLQKKKMVPNMTEDELEIFHGNRPKRDINHFFTEGVQVMNEVTPNPYFDKVPEIYLAQSKRQQKTFHMTKIYYKNLMKKFPALKYVSESKKQEEEKDSESEDEIIGPSKRTRTMIEKIKQTKHVKVRDGKKRKNNDELTEEKPLAKILKKEKVERKKEDDKTESAIIDPEEKAGSSRDSKQANKLETIKLKGPLLQLPTGSAKVYTCLQMETKLVWKGPYRANKWNLTVFYHKVMRRVLGDTHTLNMQAIKPYITFPLLGKKKDIRVTVKDFYDAIAKKEVQDGQFVERSDLEVIQLHRLDLANYTKLPPTIWLHYIYRYCLNIGDSGLYNGLTDKNLSFVFGIDMEENRRQVKGDKITDMMFSKLPAKTVVEQVAKAVKLNKAVLLQHLETSVDFCAIEALSEKYEVEFDKKQFQQRMENAKNRLKQYK